MCLILAAGYKLLNPASQNNSKQQQKVTETKSRESIPNITPFMGTQRGSYFIPYWNIPSDEPPLPLGTLNENTLMYFGITPQGTRIDESEPGYLNLTAFSKIPRNIYSERLLTLRMLDESENSTILKSTKEQQRLIDETLRIAKNYGFTGILLDLEHSVLPTKEVTRNISAFIKQFSQNARSESLTFSLTLYGDTYYRFRPYDVPEIAPHADEIYLMAYDFHKSYGEPGPNFPLKQGEKYGYSLENMLRDFTQDIPASKITVLFGLYGYDWSVDDQNRPAKAATARPLSQILTRFFPKCPLTDCTVYKDPTSSETHITYTDDTGQKHALWYEDVQSIETKIDLTRTFGIESVGFWTYGYYEQ